MTDIDLFDYFTWAWTGWTEPHMMDCAVAYWIVRPHAHYAFTLPCLHICETLKGADYKDAERYIGGRVIVEDAGKPAELRQKALVTLHMMMEFSITTSKKLNTTDWPVSQWNRLFHEQGLIELSRKELKDMKTLEAHWASLPELSRKPCLGRDYVEKS
jgi:hypothetical protein